MNPQVKEISESDGRTVCVFCHKSEVNSLEWGPFYQLAGVSVHYFCMLFSCGLSQNGEDEEGILGFLPFDIRKEVKRGEKLKCKFCKLARATIGCSVKSCKMMYHFPCGLDKDCGFQFIGNFESYCKQHKESVDIPLDDLRVECPICLDDVEEDDKKLWPPCCKRNVFHKQCIMRNAKHHGAHFFKCPLCCDKEIFSQAMRKQGVYVPERDASWETAPGAFQEHMILYSKCDAEVCLCQKGREFGQKADNKAWKIVRCGACAASAIHKRCGNLRNLTWRCPTCAEILSDKRIQRKQYDLSSDEEEIADDRTVARVVEAVPLSPDLEDDDSDVSEGQPEPERPRPVVFDERLRKCVVEENSSSSYSSSEEEDSEEPEVFVQSNSKLLKMIEAVKADDWKVSRTSTFENKLNTLAEQSSRQSSSTAVPGSKRRIDSDSDHEESAQVSEPLKVSPLQRSQLIKAPERRNLQTMTKMELGVGLEVVAETSEDKLKFSRNGLRPVRKRKPISDNNSTGDKSETLKGNSSSSGDSILVPESILVTKEDDIKEVSLLDNSAACAVECITVNDEEESSSSSDLEIVDEKLHKPFAAATIQRSSALVEMLRRKKKSSAFVRPPALADVTISAAFMKAIKAPSSFSSGNQSSSSMSEFVRKKAQKREEEIVILSDEENPAQGILVDENSKKRLIVNVQESSLKKRRRTNNLQTQL